MLEKTLDDILRISLRIAAATEECVERWPVSFAKSGERFAPGFIRLCNARLQYDRPMRRLKRRTALLQRSWNRFRRLVIITSGKRFYDKKAESPKEQAGALNGSGTCLCSGIPLMIALRAPMQTAGL